MLSRCHAVVLSLRVPWVCLSVSFPWVFPSTTLSCFLAVILSWVPWARSSTTRCHSFICHGVAARLGLLLNDAATLSSRRAVALSGSPRAPCRKRRRVVARSGCPRAACRRRRRAVTRSGSARAARRRRRRAVVRSGSARAARRRRRRAVVRSGSARAARRRRRRAVVRFGSARAARRRAVARSGSARAARRRQRRAAPLAFIASPQAAPPPSQLLCLDAVLLWGWVVMLQRCGASSASENTQPGLGKGRCLASRCRVTKAAKQLLNDFFAASPGRRVAFVKPEKRSFSFAESRTQLLEPAPDCASINQAASFPARPFNASCARFSFSFNLFFLVNSLFLRALARANISNMLRNVQFAAFNA